MNAASTTNAIDKAASAVHSVIDEAARKAKIPVNAAADLAHDASEKATSATAQATDWVSRRSEQFTAVPKKLIADTSSYVSANPLKALGIAVLAALVVGRLMR